MRFSLSSLLFALTSSVIAAGESSTEIAGRQEPSSDSLCTLGGNMCVAATRVGSNIQYTLSSQGSAVPGWMGIGFGTEMGNAPMVILWSNADGSITLSQRAAPGFVTPSVVSNPPRVASLAANASTTTGSHRYVFTVPADATTVQSLIFAFGDENPGSAAPDATLFQHIDTGTGTLDLSVRDDADTEDGADTDDGADTEDGNENGEDDSSDSDASPSNTTSPGNNGGDGIAGNSGVGSKGGMNIVALAALALAGLAIYTS